MQPPWALHYTMLHYWILARTSPDPEKRLAPGALRALQVVADRSADELGDRDALGPCPPSDFVAKLGFQPDRLD